MFTDWNVAKLWLYSKTSLYWTTCNVFQVHQAIYTEIESRCLFFITEALVKRSNTVCETFRICFSSNVTFDQIKQKQAKFVSQCFWTSWLKHRCLTSNVSQRSQMVKHSFDNFQCFIAKNIVFLLRPWMKYCWSDIWDLLYMRGLTVWPLFDVWPRNKTLLGKQFLLATTRNFINKKAHPICSWVPRPNGRIF